MVVKFSFQPDPQMRWIYDPLHPDYNTDYVQNLRDRRERAMEMCPAWMKHEALLNDVDGDR